MNVVAITGPKAHDIKSVPDPVAKAPWTRLRISVAPLCTEWKQWVEGKPNHALGHEAVGVVEDACGSRLVKPGDRVIIMPQNACGKCPLCLAGDHIHCEHPLDALKACGSESGRATLAERCLQQDWLLLPIPDDVTDDHAAMALCALGPTWNAMEQMNAGAMDTVLISGGGAVGLGGIVNAVSRGARVLVLESHPFRRALAKRLGAERVFDPTADSCEKEIMEATGGVGPDKSVETSSAPPALARLARVTRRRGHVACVGWAGEIPAGLLVGRGLHVHGAWHWNHQRDGERFLRLIRRARPLLDQLVSHRFPMSAIGEAWAVQASGACGKILVYPGK